MEAEVLAQIMNTGKLPESLQQPAASQQQPANPAQPAQPAAPASNQPAAPANEPAQPAASSQPPAQPASPAQPPAPIDFDALLTEKSGGKFKKWDDLQAQLNQPPPAAQPAPIEWKDEETKRIVLAAAKGDYAPLHDFLGKKITLSKVAQMDADTAIKTRLAMQYQNDDISAVDIERLFKKKYSADTEGMNDVQIADVNADIALQKKIDAAEARQWLASQQKDLVFPDIQQPAPENWMEIIPPQAAKYIQDMEKVDQFTQAFTTAIPTTEPPKVISLAFDDKDVKGGKFENAYDLAPDQQQFVKNAASNYWKYIETRYVKDGKYDISLMMSDIARLEYGDKAGQSSVRKALGLGGLGIVKDLKNFQEGGQQQLPAQIDPKDAIIQKAYGTN